MTYDYHLYSSFYNYVDFSQFQTLLEERKVTMNDIQQA